MQTKVLSGPPGSLLARCLFSRQCNAAGVGAETARNSKPVDHSKIFTHVSAPNHHHAQQPQQPRTPPRATGLNETRAGMQPLQQGPSRQGQQWAARQSSSSRQHCSGRQPTGSPLAGPGSRFGP